MRLNLLYQSITCFHYIKLSNHDLKGDRELPKIALPFEEGVPPTPGRVRRTYVTLDRAIRFGKTVGCKGCDRIAEGVKHSEACHERFRSLLEKKRGRNKKKL